MKNQTISSITFENFKAFSDFKVTLSDINILVGPNNSGKSTIISAFRLLNLGLRKAYNKKAEPIFIDGVGYQTGFYIDSKEASISIKNVSTDCNNKPSKIIFTLSDKKKLLISFPNNEDCIFSWIDEDRMVNTPAVFKKEFPMRIQVVPVLGPLEEDESVLTKDTVMSNLNSHRASRHFRNYWWRNDDGWVEFKNLIGETWPGMEISKPELIDGTLRMFCSEKRMLREVFWAGFGFQIWCQLLTHLSRSEQYDIVVIDEPEIYLHPDVQRQLLGLLRDLNKRILIATHSVEILSDAEPSEVMLIDKDKTQSLRLKDVKSIQSAITYLGSVHNISLAQLARTRKILFVEGIYDFKISQKLAKKAGYVDLYYNCSIIPFESGGFTNWKNIKAFSWGLDKTVDEKLTIGSVFDRDYYCSELIQEIDQDLKKSGILSFFHDCKEIENYLLSPKAICKSCLKLNDQITPEVVSNIIDNCCEQYKQDVQGQYISKRNEYFNHSALSQSTITIDTLKWFEQMWNNQADKLRIVPGKKVLEDIRTELQDRFSITLTDNRIIDSMVKGDFGPELISYLEFLFNYNSLEI